MKTALIAESILLIYFIYRTIKEKTVTKVMGNCFKTVVGREPTIEEIRKEANKVVKKPFLKEE